MTSASYAPATAPFVATDPLRSRLRVVITEEATQA